MQSLSPEAPPHKSRKAGNVNEWCRLIQFRTNKRQENSQSLQGNKNREKADYLQPWSLAKENKLPVNLRLLRAGCGSPS